MDAPQWNLLLCACACVCVCVYVCVRVSLLLFAFVSLLVCVFATVVHKMKKQVKKSYSFPNKQVSTSRLHLRSHCWSLIISQSYVWHSPSSRIIFELSKLM